MPIDSRGKKKGKVCPRTGHEGLGREKRCKSTLSLTSALDGVGGQSYASAVLLRLKFVTGTAVTTLGKTPTFSCLIGH